ncbi:MAG TPA: DUF58 domain-containing protein [Candidatus Dormibacteraeota bacterium]|nr:DUF58 domain-containing protein [Candidatus Dormibacteraeota bacterium]
MVSVQELMRRARWPVLRRLGFHPGGDERSNFRGAGLEYSDVREYQAGDDPRTIEWNITARSDRPYVRESMPDRGLDAWLLLDISRSLDWGTARCLKRDLAIEFAATVGQLLMGRGNRVGALAFDQRVRAILPPSAGRSAFLHLIARLERESKETAEPTALGPVLVQAAHLLRRPSLIMLVSDFLGSDDGWQKPLSSLALRHEVIAVWISDPRERDIPDVGVVTFEDPENGRQILIDTSDSRLRMRFQQAASQQRETIRAALHRCRVGIAELSTEAELVPQLVRFIKQRDLERSRRTPSPTLPTRGREPTGVYR